MRKFTLIFVTFCLFLLIACDNEMGHENLAPMVHPTVSSIGNSFVTISWNNEAEPEKWKYSIGLAEDSTSGDEIKGVNVGSASNIIDTFYTFNNLKPATWYKAIIHTFPVDSNSNYMPTQSWPPLKFKTLE